MNWEETVMSDKELMELAQVPPEDYGAPPHWWLRANRRVVKAQAEISFKLGQMSVVEWIGKNSDKTEICEDKGEFPGRCFYLKQWQAYLKKEGLE